MKLNIGYFYPQLLNLYGDNGNIEIMTQRAKRRGFNVDVLEINPATKLDSPLIKDLNFIFMGGGPDSGQKLMYEDLLASKGQYLKEYIENGGVALFVCGSYQLMGHYYKSADGTMLDGLGIYDMYTQHFGNKKPRCVGNFVCQLNYNLMNDPIFKSVNKLGNTLVGFENHGGRTYLGKTMTSLAKVTTGHGNNSEDKTEGLWYKNSFGTYSHGPILSRNPHFADYLLAKSLGLAELTSLDDSLIIQAHAASKKLRQ